MTSFRAVACGLWLCLAFSSCTASTPEIDPLPSESATTEFGGSFRYGITEPGTILAPLASSPAALAVVDTLYDSLTRWDLNGTPHPAAASVWEHNETFTEWTFRLRYGATFHDGQPVTARDFVVSWTTLVQRGAYGYLLDDVIGAVGLRTGLSEDLTGVTALDSNTIVVQLYRPRADFPVIVGHPALGPVPSSIPIEPGSDVQIGNGPFQMEEPWVRHQFIRVTPFRSWLNGTRRTNSIDEVVFHIADPDVNFLAFTQGRRELVTVPAAAFGTAQETFPNQGDTWSGPGLITGGNAVMYVLAVNRSVPPYDDKRIREAVSFILNRRRIAAENEGGNLRPATSLIPPGVPGWEEGTCRRCQYFPAAAESRFAAGQVDQISWWYSAGSGHERIRDVLRQDLSDVGVSLVSNGRRPPLELGEYQQVLASGEAGLFRLPVSADVPSMLHLVLPLLHRDSTPENGGLNYLRYDDPTVTALLDQAARTENPTSRNELVHRAVDIAMNRDQVLIPVFSYQHAVVVSDQAKEVQYDPFGQTTFTRVTISE